jgi:hypothetical protein
VAGSSQVSRLWPVPLSRPGHIQLTNHQPSQLNHDALLDEDGLFADTWGCPPVSALAGASPVPQEQLPAGMTVPQPCQPSPTALTVAPAPQPQVAPTGDGVDLGVVVAGYGKNGDPPPDSESMDSESNLAGPTNKSFPATQYQEDPPPPTHQSQHHLLLTSCVASSWSMPRTGSTS